MKQTKNGLMFIIIIIVGIGMVQSYKILEK